MKRLAHPGGKIVTSNKDACLLKLLARKEANGEVLTTDQRRALSTLRSSGANMTPVAAPQTEPLSKPNAPLISSRAPKTAAPPVASLNEANSKRIRALRKKLHDIEELEQRASEGAILQANQQAKIALKGTLASELATLEGRSS